VLSGTVGVTISVVVAASGNVVFGGSASVLFDVTHLPTGGMVFANSVTARSTFVYSAVGGAMFGAGAVYATGVGAVLGGAATVMVFRVADLPTGGMVLASNVNSGGRYFDYDASGGLQIIILEAARSFTEISPYFLSIEDTLVRGRMDPCAPGNTISKHAVIGLLTGTATKTLLDQADDWEVACVNNPNQGDITLLVYKDQKITKIVWNVFVAHYPKTIPAPELPVPETDLRQYRVEIQYPGDYGVVPEQMPEDTPNIGYEPLRAVGENQGRLPIFYPGDAVVGYDSAPEETVGVAVMPIIRTEIVRAKPVAAVISQASLLGLVGPYHFLNKLSRNQWDIIEFRNRVATIKLNGKNRISVTV
jgi:hypothetical protein